MPITYDSRAPEVTTLSTLGMFLLMFSVGLSFRLRKLLALGARPVFVGLAEAALSASLAWTVGRSLGLDARESIFAACVFAFSSTIVMLKTLDDLGLSRERFVEPLMGILIVEDLVTILVLVLLSATFLGGAEGGGAATGAALALAKGGIPGLALLVVSVVAGWWALGAIVAPRLTALAERHGGSEMLVILSVGLCLGAGLLFNDLGLSGALGAFLMGAIVADTRQIRVVSRDVGPLRDIFVALFFVSFGLRMDPRLLVDNAGAIAAFFLAFVLGKILIVFACGTLAGYPPCIAAKLGLILTPIGEFSFVIADLGARVGVLDADFSATVVGVAVLTSFTTPLLARNDERIVDAIARRLPARVRRSVDGYAGRLDALLARRLRPTLDLPIGTRLSRLVGSATQAFHTLFDRASGASTSSTLGRLAPWEEYPVEIEVEKNSPAKHASLAELSLKESHSVIAVALESDGVVHVPPEPARRFSAGDVVLVYGDEAHIAAATSLYRASPSSPGLVGSLQEVSLRRLSIDGGHPFEGFTLRELAVRRRAGALVLAVGRGDERVKTPPPDFRVEIGDELFLVGATSRLRHLLGAREAQ